MLRGRAHGRAVQADSIKTRVESTYGFYQRLKLECHHPPSTFAFKFGLRPSSTALLGVLQDAVDPCTAPELLLVAAGALALGVQTSAVFARAVNTDREGLAAALVGLAKACAGGGRGGVAIADSDNRPAAAAAALRKLLSIPAAAGAAPPRMLSAALASRLTVLTVPDLGNVPLDTSSEEHNAVTVGRCKLNG